MNKVGNLYATVEEDVNIPASDSAATDWSPEETGSLIPDNELFIRQAFKNDPKFGCELLYRHYYQALCTHATRLLYSKSRAEDLVADVFCQFYINGTFKEITTSYRAFLYKSVRNRAYNYFRLEAKRSVELDHKYEERADLISQQPDSILQYEELCQEAEAAINSLPTKCKKIYLMHRMEEKKYAEIAEELQLSTRTVEAQVRKASQYVKRMLSRNWTFLLFLLNSFS